MKVLTAIVLAALAIAIVIILADNAKEEPAADKDRNSITYRERAAARDELQAYLSAGMSAERRKDMPPADPLLMQLAQAHAEDMAVRGYLHHLSAVGGATPDERALAAGYDCMAGQHRALSHTVLMYDPSLSLSLSLSRNWPGRYGGPRTMQTASTMRTARRWAWPWSSLLGGTGKCTEC